MVVGIELAYILLYRVRYISESWKLPYTIWSALTRR